MNAGLFGWSASVAAVPTPSGGAAARASSSGASSTDDPAKEMGLLTARLCIQSSNILRSMIAMLYDVFLGAKDNPYLSVVQTTGASYYARVKGNPKHKEGPPHLHLAASLMSTGFTDPAATPAEKDLLTQVATNYNTPDLLGGLFLVVRYSKTYQGGIKLQIGYSKEAHDLGLPATFRRLLQASGLVFKRGEPPRGPLERQLQALLPAPAAGGGGEGMEA